MEEVLLSNNPNLKASTLYNYITNLKKLYRDLFKSDDYDLEKFNQTSLIVDYLKDLPLGTRSAMFVYLSTLTKNPVYKEEGSKLKKIRESTPLPAADAEHTIAEDEIKQKFKELKKQSTLIYKGVINKDSLIQLQNTILIAVVGNIYFPPRRNKDWTEMLLHTKRDDANYIDGNEFVFNEYKTQKYYGQQRVKIPPPLKKLIDEYKSVCQYEYLFTSIFGKQLQSITPRLNEIFGRSVGVNSFRRNALHEYKHHLEERKEINDVMGEMGSSVNMLKHYVR